jgi:hypothetical protein
MHLSAVAPVLSFRFKSAAFGLPIPAFWRHDNFFNKLKVAKQVEYQ